MLAGFFEHLCKPEMNCWKIPQVSRVKLENYPSAWIYAGVSTHLGSFLALSFGSLRKANVVLPVGFLDALSAEVDAAGKGSAIGCREICTRESGKDFQGFL